MAECGDVQCCEMAEVELQPVELWEDNHSRFENLFQEKRNLYQENSPFFDYVRKIRGTYIIIINYFNTFSEFATTPEALNLTFNCNDELDRIWKEYTSDETYFTSLLKCLKTVADEVHTRCFVTHNTDIKSLKKSASQTGKKSKVEVSLAPNKKQKLASSVKTLKKDVVVSSVSTQNKYEVFSGLPAPDETITSLPKVTSVPVAEMETSEQTEITVT